MELYGSPLQNIEASINQIESAIDEIEEGISVIENYDWNEIFSYVPNSENVKEDLLKSIEKMISGIYRIKG